MSSFVPSTSLLLAMLVATGAAAQSADGTFSSNQRFVPKNGEVLYRSICQGCPGLVRHQTCAVIEVWRIVDPEKE